MSISPWTRPLFAPPPRSVLILIAVILFLSFGLTAGFAQATNFAIGTTAQRQDVQRLGINLGGQDYYDSGQMLRNLIGRNPGFEGQEWQSVVDCVAVSATSCTDGNLWNTWPANFLAGATFEVMNGAAQGETGTISGNTISAYAAGNSSNPNYGITINFSSPLATPVAVGDYVAVRLEEPGDATAGWWTSTSGGGSLSTDTTDIAPDSPGKQALEISADGSGQSASVTSYFDSFSGRSFVQLNGTYTLTFKAKGLGGSNQLNIFIQRIGTQHGNVDYLNQSVALTGQWQDYSYTFTANEDGSYIGTVQASFTASGASLYLDDVALTEAAAPDNPTAYRNAVVDRLRQLRPGVLRLNTTQDIGATIDNELATPFARHPAGWSSVQNEVGDIPMGLHEFLVLCQAVGAEPWFSMSGETSPTDMQHLIEYLAGDASTPYGSIRAALGQTAPWTTVFPVIHLELGNEMWNSMMAGEGIMDAGSYGRVAASIFAAARSSPYYNPSSFDLIMGGWAAVPYWTQQAMANSSGYDSVDAAPYLFDTLSDYSSNENIFGPMFAQPEQIDSEPNGYMAEQAQVATGGSPPAKLEIYEVNIGTSSGTAPQNVVNQVVGGLGGGIALADHMLLMMRDLGVTLQNVYALSGYSNTFENSASSSYETMPLYGATVDMGGETNANRPSFLAEQLANQAIMPTMLAVAVSGANPTWNQPLSANDTVEPIQLANAHYLQSFAFTDGTHYSVVVFNLSRSGSLPITFSGANAPNGDVLISQLTSQNPTDNNEGLTSDTPVVHTTQSDVSGFNPATPYSLPPFSMTVFEWPNASLPPTTTMLGANPVSVDAGAPVTLTANVTSQSGSNTPTGTVTFMNGGTTLGSGTLNSSGVATLTTTALPAGADSVTASYGGDSNDAGSVSTAVTVTVTSTAVATTTTLAASPITANTGQAVTLTATVTQSGGGVPQGTVTFLNGAASLGVATLNASGIATLTTTALPAGADSITASYAGNTSDAASASAAVTVNVNQTVSTTSTSLLASATQITPGQSVTLMATVTPQSGGAPSGTVTFLNGNAILGVATLNSSGSASYSTSALPSGTNSITASYAGNTSDSASVSPAVTITVAQGAVATTTALASSATSINTGQSVTFTAKVVQQSGTTIPAGTVAFLNGSTILGTATLDAGGGASFSTTALPAGTDSITASYGGSTGFNSSVSAAVAVTVKQTVIPTTTTLALSASQIIAGQSLTLTATVAPQSGSMPTGSVTFLDGTVSLGTASLNGGGVASFSTSALAAGTHSITASYAGSSSNSASTSVAQSVQVASAPVHTTTSLAASSGAINTGQSVTFTATVTPQTAGSTLAILPVAFLDGSTIIGTANINASGIATFTTSALPAGSDSVTASYTGNTVDLSSVSSPVTVQVTQTLAATTTTLTASASQIGSGGNVVFTATVLAAGGAATPTGSVTFLDGATTLGTAALNASGGAFFSTSQLGVGVHQVTASYGGSSTDSKSASAQVAVTVVQSIQPTTTSLISSAAQITYGSNVTFTAAVNQQSGGAVSSGSVTFLDGGAIVATAPLNASGVAVFNTRSLAIGSHSITAAFSGTSTNSSSSSAAVSISILPSQGAGQASTDIALTASSAQIASGQSVTLTAALTSSAGYYALSGNVSFLDGSNVLGASGINSTGGSSFTTSALTPGTHTLTAIYGGNDQTASAVSSPVTVEVTPAPAITPAQVLAATTTTLASSASQVTAGDAVTFTATVSDQTGNGMPSGTVQFLDGNTALGGAPLASGGSAAFTTSSLAAGTHTISAAYQGDVSNAASTSSAVTVIVAAPGTPGYTMSVSASDVSVKPGEVANLTVTVTPENGFNKPVNLTCTSPLKGTTCSFSPATVTPNGGPVSSTLSILVSSMNSATAQNRPPSNPFGHSRELGMVMPWGIFSLAGLSRRKRRSRMRTWSIRVIAALALTMGSLWISGCGYQVNSSNFTMTLTSSGANVPTHTSQITVNVLQ